MAVVTVAVDAMGGDRAPAEIIAGVRAAVVPGTLEVVLVGDERLIRDGLGSEPHAGITIRHAGELITFEDDPVTAVRAKSDASLVVTIRGVKEGWANAAVSAGATGAMLAASLFSLRRIPGVIRPGLAAVLPGALGPVTLLDCGASVDSRPQQLSQYAHMGLALARDVLGVANPTVGLLSVGEEPGKGDARTREAYADLDADPALPFIGNVEGRDIMVHRSDIVVCDGFAGNIALKAIEGAGKYFFSSLRDKLGKSARGKLGGLLIGKPARTLRARLDPETYGGAYLLGVQGVVVVAHGSSSRVAIANACRYAAAGVRAGVCDHIEEAMRRR